MDRYTFDAFGAFTAAGWCSRDQLKINYGILGHVNKEHVLQFKSGKVTCFKIVWTMELYGTEEYAI